MPRTGTIELVAMDPRQGAMFYTLNGVARPVPSIIRRDTCLQCHHGVATMGVPGLLRQLGVPDRPAGPIATGAIVTDHRTWFADRWGGWYVTGTHGATRHRGNAVAGNPAEPTVLDVTGAGNLTSLAGRFDPADYLEPTSDLVALMTLEHQTQGLEPPDSSRLGGRVAAAGGLPLPGPTTSLDERVDQVVRYLLLVDEPPLPAPLAGVSSFTRTFPARGPRDARGRSLRDFDLQTRLFRYPLEFPDLQHDVRRAAGRRARAGLPAAARRVDREGPPSGSSRR